MNSGTRSATVYVQNSSHAGVGTWQSVAMKRTRDTLPMVVTPDVAAALKVAVEKSGRSYDELAEALGTSKTTISNILNAKVTTSPWLRPLANALGVDLAPASPRLDDDQLDVLEALELARSAGAGAEFVALVKRTAEAMATVLMAQTSAPPMPQGTGRAQSTPPALPAAPALPRTRGSSE